MRSPFGGLFFDWRDSVRLLTSTAPLSKAATARCPQCGGAMDIRLVEPDLRDARKAQHMFECKECGLPRIYLVYDESRSPRRRHNSKREG